MLARSTSRNARLEAPAEKWPRRRISSRLITDKHVPSDFETSVAVLTFFLVCSTSDAEHHFTINAKPAASNRNRGMHVRTRVHTETRARPLRDFCIITTTRDESTRFEVFQSENEALPLRAGTAPACSRRPANAPAEHGGRPRPLSTERRQYSRLCMRYINEQAISVFKYDPSSLRRHSSGGLGSPHTVSRRRVRNANGIRERAVPTRKCCGFILENETDGRNWCSERSLNPAARERAGCTRGPLTTANKASPRICRPTPRPRQVHGPPRPFVLSCYYSEHRTVSM
ncbi:hypothetical protein EVAR_33735_1 [Eumeta japonica]|uniref:Uncharacterized protein n=1 Tax=Eumeta variegata TaxID=151549 RepID=A0A4C1VV38_EUMVA|nr:hypothetical protein EVAR_33735_1 [Eumeta japonica]